MKRSLNYIIHFRMPWKLASTELAGQAMQTFTIHLPAPAARMRIQTSAPTLRAMATLKLSESSSVSCDETGKAY